MATTTKIMVGIDDQVIELLGADKEAFIADRQATNEARLLLETEYAAKQAAKQNILKKLGLTQDELETLLGA